MAGPLRVLDLFSGIGGFSLGLERAGMKTVAFCEIDPFCRRVLAKHWPDVPCHHDITKLEADHVGTVDVVCGGFPCQDISSAGTKLGLDGPRSGLWSEFRRLVCELRPKYVLVENVSDMLHRGIERVLGDLAGSGYDAEWQCISSADVGAPHERQRLWIVAYSNTFHGLSRMGIFSHDKKALLRSHHSNRSSIWLEAARRLTGVGHGFSDFVDRRERTEALGNAVVPQIPELIGRAILEVEGRA